MLTGSEAPGSFLLGVRLLVSWPFSASSGSEAEGSWEISPESFLLAYSG
jgi:hypothetical protein